MWTLFGGMNSTNSVPSWNILYMIAILRGAPNERRYRSN
jgi:hypothetical protein